MAAGSRVVLVTGAGRGFGQAIARRFGHAGDAVAVTSRSENELDQTVGLIEQAGGRGLAIAGDCTSSADVARIVAEVEYSLGPIEVFVNNAGVPGPFGPMWLADPQQWWAAQRVHVLAPLLFINNIVPGMVERKRGHVVIVSAKGGWMVSPNMSAYCTGKSGQIRMTALLAAELEPYGVCAFSIDPGFAVTQLAVDTMNDSAAQRWVPGMVERLAARDAQDPEQHDLDRCAQRCFDLASGRYDPLSGNYYEPSDDIEQALAAAQTRATNAP